MAARAQLNLYNEEEDRTQTSTTFADNLSLGVHRWFRYSAGFSADWAAGVLARQKAAGDCSVLDPFAGSGTTVLEAQRLCMNSVGVEAHPLVLRVAQAKLMWTSAPSEYLIASEEVLRAAEANIEKATRGVNMSLLQRIFTGEALEALLALRLALEQANASDQVRPLLWLTLCSILRECSTAGTAQWQYVLPKKSKSRVSEPLIAFRKRALLFASDMRARQDSLLCRPSTQIVAGDARTCKSVGDSSVDFVLTSPPYANNYDYADATRIEMTFFGEISGWGDLHEAVRKYLIRSCSQHAVLIQKDVQTMVRDPKLSCIAPGLIPICDELALVREGKGGKKPYHALIAAYFFDMADVMMTMRRVIRPGGRACFVIGDSAPYGVHVPVETWIGDLAISSGFQSYAFEKTRDRNTKWKNRKHTVPLQEGRLWIEG